MPPRLSLHAAMFAITSNSMIEVRYIHMPARRERGPTGAPGRTSPGAASARLEFDAKVPASGSPPSALAKHGDEHRRAHSDGHRIRLGVRSDPASPPFCPALRPLALPQRLSPT